MNRRISGSIALTSLLLVATAACGGEEAKPTITKEAFITQANAICKAGTAEMDSMLEAFGDKQPTQDQIETYIVEAMDNVLGQVEDIRELGLPAGDEDKLNGVLDDAKAAAEKVKADPAAAMTMEDPFADVNKELNDYGLTECGN